MTYFQRQLQQQQDRACTKCQGNGTLANRHDVMVNGVLQRHHWLDQCDLCKGTGTK